MKLNRMTDYAIQILRSISEHEKEVVTSKQISESEGIPHGVLMKVLRILRINGFIQSYQGRGEISGGYALSKSIKEITLLQVVEAMEGPVQLSSIDGDSLLKEGRKAGLIYQEYQRISDIICKEMSRYSIYDVLSKRNK